MALTLENVEYSTGDFSLSADCEIADGTSVALIGPSGAGKSTLLDLIAGFRSPKSGRILWNGQDITAMPPGKRPFGILFQDNNLFPHLSILQNLALALHPNGARPGPGDCDKIADALSQVDLAGMEQRKPGALSGGQQSRAALARVLLQRRPALLLDEPFAALGPALRRDMLGLVTRLATQNGKMALLVTHDPEDARLFAAQTLLVSDGQAQKPAPTKDLFANPPKALRAYLGPQE